MKHWRIDQMNWEAFDASRVDPEIIPVIKAAAVVERNGLDYGVYLANVFVDDPDFRQAADNWAVEEVQHGDALGKWAMLADPSWDYISAFERYRTSYQIDQDVDVSIRGSRTGELIARCIVETGTSSFYTAMADSTSEPVLKAICKQIAADEYRHFKLFYDHMHRYLRRENLGVWQRTRIALGRVTESEDDELATAYHTTNASPETPYDHKASIAAYMARAMGCYEQRHINRVTSMIFKTIGVSPHSWVQIGVAKVIFALIKVRAWRFKRQLAAGQAMTS